MAARAQQTPVLQRAHPGYPEHVMPHMVVPPGYKKLASDLLRVVLAHSRTPDAPGGPITRDELLFIQNNMRILFMSSIQCFSDEVQPFEFPDPVVIPALNTFADDLKLILVLVCNFCLASGDVDCYYLGFRFTDDLELRAQIPQGNDILLPVDKLSSVYSLLHAVRARTAWTIPAPSSASPDAAPVPRAPDVRSLRDSVDVLLACNQTTDTRRSDPGAFIFCRLEAVPAAADGASVFIEQIVARAEARLWHYKTRSDAPVSERRLDTLFAASTASDFCHEFYAVLVLAVVLKCRAEYFVQCELALMALRVEKKLTDAATRRKFLELNGLLDPYTAHQATCAHAKYECFTQYVCEQYRATLDRLTRITDYLMYGIDPAQTRSSDQSSIDTLTLLVEKIVKIITSAP